MFFNNSAKQQPFTMSVWTTSPAVQNLADGFSMDYTQVKMEKQNLKTIILIVSKISACLLDYKQCRYIYI